MILGARIIALVEGGVLEGRGNLWNIQQSDVRLIPWPSTPSTGP